MVRIKNNERHTYTQEHTRTLFNSIAHRYDFLNHVLSFGIDVIWRKRAIRFLRHVKPKIILDVAAGTADFSLEAARLSPEKIIGIDISVQMLNRGRIKVHQKRLDHIITLELGTAEQLRFESSTFDAVISAFGVRNFENLGNSLKEFYRVLRNGGTALVLEFSKPTVFPVKQFYRFYSHTILPFLGGFVSKNRFAYTYLPNTISEFPECSDFCRHLQEAGFSNVRCSSQTFGIVSIYLAQKES